MVHAVELPTCSKQALLPPSPISSCGGAQGPNLSFCEVRAFCVRLNIMLDALMPLL